MRNTNVATQKELTKLQEKYDELKKVSQKCLCGKEISTGDDYYGPMCGDDNLSREMQFSKFL